MRPFKPIAGSIAAVVIVAWVLLMVVLSQKKIGEGGPSTYSAQVSELQYDGYLPSWELRESDWTTDGGRLLIHTWFEGSKPFAGFDIMFKAFLLTQDLARTKFIMWTTEPWLEHGDALMKEIVKSYRHFPAIEFRIVDPPTLARKTCWEQRKEFLDRETIEKFGMRDWSNVLRWLLLHKYGGVWLDADSFPILDLTEMYRLHPDKIIAGFVPGPNTSADYVNKQEGHFNNNFLMVTDKAARRVLIDLTCEFRREPLGVDSKGNQQWTNVIPTVASGEELFVFNHWIFNDGVLRLCWMHDDCPMEPIGLGEVDPTWYRTNDLNAICERLIQSLHGYNHQFAALLKSVRTETQPGQGLQEYLYAFDWTKHVWVIHTRGSHCRTLGAEPVGMYKYFTDLMDAKLRALGGPPVHPDEFMTYDPLELPTPRHRMNFVKVHIFIQSDPKDFARRQTIRGALNSPDWQTRLFPAISTGRTVWFVINYKPLNENERNARLHTELYKYNDVILVDSATDTDATYTGWLPEIFARATLKLLQTYDGLFFAYLRSSDVFVSLSSLFAVIGNASQTPMFQKDVPIKSFVITEAVSGLPPVNEAVPHSHMWEPKKRSPQFIVTTRNMLPDFVGNAATVLNFTFTRRPKIETLEVTNNLLPEPSPIKPSPLEAFFDGNELAEAKAAGKYPVYHLEHFGGVGLPINQFSSIDGPRYSSTRFDFGKEESMCYGDPFAKNKFGEGDLGMIPRNLTVVWDIPCNRAYREVTSYCLLQADLENSERRE